MHAADRISDGPGAHIPRDRRRAIAAGTLLPEEVTGAALFADISGFTALTEALALELGPRRGAEELTRHLDRVFHAVIDDVHRVGGEVIFFSGDAITCWVDADDGTRAAACGLAMQESMARVGLVRTGGGVDVLLGIKVAICVGSARRFVVGDPDIQLIEVLAGSLLDRLAAIEQVASPGEVLIDAVAARSLAERGAVDLNWRDGPHSGDAVVLVDAVLTPVEDVDAFDAPMPVLAEEQVRPWLLPVIYERLTTGRGEFLAELRSAYPMFVRFAGFDHDRDISARARLDRFVRLAQAIVVRHGGNVLQLTIGDKGAYLYIVFGSPVSHDDDAVRAVAAANELQRASARVADGLGIQIGITHGRLRSGTCGHPDRRTFACLGDAVNLAARLMAACPEGAIHVAESVKVATGARFVWRPLGRRSVKGKVDGVDVYELHGVHRVPVHRTRRYPLPIVGRDHELTVLADAYERARSGRGELVVVTGDAGQGKSRLLAEVIRRFRAGGARVVVGEGQSVVSNYEIWREVWQSLLGVDGNVDDPDEARAAVSVTLQRLAPTLALRAPLVGPVLGLSLPDNDLTASFDAKLRKASLESLLASVLRAVADIDPVVIVLEDAHWIDQLSRDLLTVVLREIVEAPVLVVLAARPSADLVFDSGPAAIELALGELDATAVGAVIHAKSRQLFGRAPSDELVQLVADRAGGNPFHLEELLQYLVHLGVDLDDADAIRRAELPDSLHALVLSRVDGLAEGPRRTLKVASVVGSQFDAEILAGAYPDLGGSADIAEVLGVLHHVDLVTPEPYEDDGWIFHNAVIREVAYESIPFAMRRELHERVAVHLEDHGPDIDRLAHHYWHTDNQAKKRTYLGLAGAKSQAAYANAAAIDYYERLATLVEGATRAEVLLKLGKVLELTGDWDRAGAVASEALGLAEVAGDRSTTARCESALAEVARKQGRYGEAAERLQRAREAFETSGDAEGLGQVLHVAGTLAAQQGDYDEARGRYRESLTIRDALGDRSASASLLSNLGVVAEYEGDLDAARAFHEQALVVRRSLNDRWSIAVSLTNLGMVAIHQRRHDDAQHLFDEALRLNSEVGDPWMVAIAHHNLGNAWRGLSDHDRAAGEYALAEATYLRHDDRWALAFLLEDQALLASSRRDHHEAVRLLGAADAMRDAIGATRAPSLTTELENMVDVAREAIGDAAAVDAVRAQGRTDGRSTVAPPA